MLRFYHVRNCVALLITWVLFTKTATGSLSGGILYPQETETREVKFLDGIWNFRKSDTSSTGFTEEWYKSDLSQTGDVIPMPVPSSYNDITVSKELRDHVGSVWYDRRFFLPDSWRKQGHRVWIRFGSVHYSAKVYINGHLAVEHDIGHLPFQTEITSLVFFGSSNRVTVAVDNTLTSVTIPQGSLQKIATINGSETIQSYTFDFFNYAGIHRHVHIYTTPVHYIDDITIKTDINATTGYIYYNISHSGEVSINEKVECSVKLYEKNSQNEVQNVEYIEYSDGVSGKITVPNATFWWPYLMDPNPGYVYTLMIKLKTSETVVEDVYRIQLGIRTVNWDNTSFFINGKPAYIRGVGRHEDSDIRGKGLDYALIARDYNMLKWLGINAYRTSHYPYAEEILDFADREGIMIIDECSAVDIENFSPKLLQHHMDSLAELIRRDKNRPSVVMWSIANEPRSSLHGADSYFRYVVKSVKILDVSRPVTAAINKDVTKDEAAQYLDIIGFNRYNAWYQNPGRTESIQLNVEEEATAWHKKHNKPIFMTEYGADTYPGLHIEPEYIWSEEYQIKVLSEHFKAFDNLRAKKFFIGEMLWNFADFKTAQTYTRVGGNKKGILTRERQPKSAAHHLRQRNFKLAQIIDNFTLPQGIDFEKYTASPQLKNNKLNEEL